MEREGKREESECLKNEWKIARVTERKGSRREK